MLLQAYNNTEHSTTGQTPFFVMCGWHARLPVFLISGAEPQKEQMNLHGWVRHHHNQLGQVYGWVEAKA